MPHVRFAPLRFLNGLLLLCLLTLCSVSFAQTLPTAPPAANAPTEREQVKAFLQHYKDNARTDAEFNKIKALGKRALPLLADYLLDEDLGLEAGWTMHEIDAAEAMPYLLEYIDSENHQIQDDTFGYANQKMQEYDLRVRSKKPLMGSTITLSPLGTPNERPYPFQGQVYAAAVRRLQSGNRNFADCSAIISLGLTGSQRDLPLLYKWAAKDSSDKEHPNFYRECLIAALVRLGDKQALDSIAAELSKPVLPYPAQPSFMYNGKRVKVVASREDSRRIRQAASQAEFSMNPRFVALLLRHLDDPLGQDDGDVSEASPAVEAMNALSQIVDGKNIMQTGRTVQEWKQWGREQGVSVGK